MSSLPPPPAGIDPATWNTILHIRTGCFPVLVPQIKNDYGYWPSLGAGISFDILFGLALIGHAVQAIRFGRWTSVLFAIGALTEAIGWAGRTWNAKCPYNHDAFLMQITTLIIAPTFFAAGLYVLLGTLIKELGPQTSCLSPSHYAIIFCTCDIISLVVQAVGGALAAKATVEIGGNSATGTHIMVAGIAFQLFTMSIFALLVLDFLRRASGLAITRQMKLVLVALFVVFLMIYVRSIYRTIELAEGWTGFLITHERYFIGLDATLMVVTVAVFLVFDPAVLLRQESITRDAGDGEVQEQKHLLSWFQGGKRG
ncbi:rta1 domain [Trichoderma arundinaceum]|uniref:Rta1 domain n=1 Tax=Trichoderma arundinaceum TaxID=490622 RepID=A0A395NFL5_TRIAR|nr:rta1 domain [Trichoderma arundinaceum]